MSGGRYPLSSVAKAVGGVCHSISDPTIEHLLIDSRKVDVPDASLFIALKGPRHDGHRYIKELLARGVRNFLVMDEPEVSLLGQANFILVPDTLVAFQQIAAWHRSHFNYPVIGITGSNGKTIVKEWLYQMLRGEERIVRSPGSWNSQVGVPLSVWQMGPEHTLGIFEAGISKPGEMEKLEAIIRPTLCVLTNIGDAHDEGFGGDREAKSREKSVLFHRAEAVVYNKHTGMPHPAPTHAVRLDIAEDDVQAFVNVQEAQVVGGACSVDLVHGGKEMSFTVPFNDNASIENAITCIAVLLHLGRSVPWINERLAHLTPVDMRLRTMQGQHGTTLIDDSYSNDRSSLAVALEHQRRIAHGRDRVVVLSDIAESDRADEQLYREVADMLERSGVARVVGVGPHISVQRGLFPEGSRFHADAAALLANEDPKHFAGAVVLVKGARTFAFERVVERWQQQVHGTELEIDLEAVRHNLNHYRALLAPGVRTMAMVKAFGYGAGALELARLFAHEQVHYLGVAYADEGIELRQQGITLPIMVMNPEPVAMETLHRFQLEAEVYDQRSLHEAMQSVELMADAPPIHIKLDTGMHRLGFVERELPELLDTLRAGTKLKVASIFSHLVASEDPKEDEYTHAQIAAFTRMATAIGEVLGYKPLWHLANSAGIARWPSAHFDMVRIGIGLHGISSDATETAQLLPVASLRTPIAQLKNLTAGDTVGYNRRGAITGDRVIATLPIGYADGFSRRLGNGIGRVWINGKAAPLIGNVCMDMCMVDVTGIPCSVGDLAVVFDAAHPVTEVARDMGTIPYEVLTGISQRVKRVYVRG
ncbi:MAG: bifunctional UDP-N-acetylmuramoyl-tripeptide:D-alanyl-D-alanine ligase/alanine racemase [Flavobacteriales bacterium]|nr:bifunctional UDP-N-acetylmuramoyl-tripeptide:D-alanyl-D-alanine ligase/alanine racemase [Flavobacteriales bacterium]